MRKQRTHGTTYTLTREGASNVGGGVVVYYQTPMPTRRDVVIIGMQQFERWTPAQHPGEVFACATTRPRSGSA